MRGDREGEDELTALLCLSCSDGEPQLEEEGGWQSEPPVGEKRHAHSFTLPAFTCRSSGLRCDCSPSGGGGNLQPPTAQPLWSPTSLPAGCADRRRERKHAVAWKYSPCRGLKECGQWWWLAPAKHGLQVNRYICRLNTYKGDVWSSATVRHSGPRIWSFTPAVSLLLADILLAHILLLNSKKRSMTLMSLFPCLLSTSINIAFFLLQVLPLPPLLTRNNKHRVLHIFKIHELPETTHPFGCCLHNQTMNYST